MDIVEFSIKKPVTVVVGVILVLLFGFIGLFSLPYQLSPTVTEPEISVTTIWQGATPYEVEREILEEQEEVLKGLTGLTTMESTAYNSRAEISLRFQIGTDIDDALLRVSNKLNEVPSYPLTVDKPIISATGASTNPVIWTMLQALPGNTNDINTYRTYFEDEVRQYLERVEGVADLFTGGGREREMHIVVDPDKLAAYNLTVTNIIGAFAAENVNISAGTMEMGRREYRIRTVGEFQSAEELESMVIYSDGARQVLLGDVAEAGIGYEKLEAFILHDGETGIVCGIKPEPGANILELTDNVEAVVNELNAGKLKEEGLELSWAHDQRPYIEGAIDLVQRNIMIGGVLAVIVLLTFLGSVSSTLIVAAAIPISIIGTFLFLNLLGRNLNVVSLAGISFAVGMLVDNAIVVLENIDRHRRMGKPPFQAAYDGAREVWGAIVASTATTVAVFLPVIFMQEEAGQLFKDIAIAVTGAILISLFVSISVIPMLADQFFSLSKRKFGENNSKISGPKAIYSWAGRFAESIMGLVRLSIKNVRTRLTTIILLTFLAVLTAWALFPKMEYLPQGNQNFVLNILIPPPGLSTAERADIGRGIHEALKPHYGKDINGLPGVEMMFYVGASRIMIFGVKSIHEQRAGELVPFFFRMINSIPGMFGVSMQAGIFQQRLSGGRTIDVDLSSGDMNRLLAGAGAMFGAVREAVPGAQIRPVPSLEQLFPEVKLKPYRDRLKAVGMSATDLGTAVDVLMDGRKIGEFKKEGQKKIDLVLTAPEEDVSTPEDLYNSIIAVPGGRTVPLSSLAELERTTGINQIRHLERRRTITLQVTPPPEIPLEQAMETISQGLVPKLRDQGVLKGIDFRMSGAADKLTQTRRALQWNFLLAVVIIYLLMSALFGNFIYPFVILFTVPLAAAGGILGLKLENIFIANQPMDILTMLGFVILIGVVVNNAILIVHQSLNNIRIHNMEHKEAVLEAVKTRLRPIYMSACTSIFGMLPLAVAPGPGSELYRGLGSVVLGGLAVSTIFTVFVIPPLLMFFIGMEKRTPSQAEAE